MKRKILFVWVCLTCFHHTNAQEAGGLVLNKYRHYLLNIIPTDVKNIGYSTRRLNAYYTGAAMNVRRSSDNAQGDVAFYGPTGVVSANSIVTITVKGSSSYAVGQTVTFSSFYSGTNVYVTKWYDQSGNADHAAQATTSAQPQIVKSGSLITENGIPSVEFSGSHTSVYLSLGTSLSLANGSLFGVYKVVSTSSTAGFAENGTYSYNLNTYNNTGYIGVTYYTISDNPSTLAYNTTTLDLVAWRKSSGNSYVDVSNRTASSTAGVNIPIAVSQVYGNSLSGTVVHISEFIITGYYTTTMQRGYVFNNQQSFFGTP